jgi:pyruvate dehydrogenase E2 component (dihydrolipoamide acetyltransferase)
VAELREFRLPDIGDFEHVDVVEVLVKVGDRVEKEQGLVVLESDKATMELPAPFAGVVRELAVSAGDQVSEGDLVALLEPAEGAVAAEGADAARAPAAGPAPDESAAEEHPPEEPAPAAEAAEGLAPDAAPDEPAARAEPARERAEPASARGARDRGREERAGLPGRASPAAPPAAPATGPLPHASPSVRRLARELGVDLGLVPGSGRKGRITPEDVQGFVKASLRQGPGGVPIAGVRVAAPVEIDFSKFGPTELQPLNRVRRVASANLHRSWVTVPHVTQFDEADVTDLDTFRKEQGALAQARGVKLTFLPFVIQACVSALRAFPHFNASLDATGENLIVKRYYHVGVAVDTEHGLVVPVVHDADRKGLLELAAELQSLSEKARARRLGPAELQGGSFSISSLGGIGGTFFTPIVNHPEVAILGVSKMEWKPVWRDGAFVPRLLLPLSLSYDHRVIDGADAVRFTRRVAELLSDLRRLLL